MIFPAPVASIGGFWSAMWIGCAGILAIVGFSLAFIEDI